MFIFWLVQVIWHQEATCTAPDEEMRYPAKTGLNSRLSNEYPWSQWTLRSWTLPAYYYVLLLLAKELKKCLESCGTGEDCPLVFTGISQGGGTVRDSSVLLKGCRVCLCQFFSLSFSLSSLSFSRRQLPSFTGPSMTRLWLPLVLLRPFTPRIVRQLSLLECLGGCWQIDVWCHSQYELCWNSLRPCLFAERWWGFARVLGLERSGKDKTIDVLMTTQRENYIA